MLRLLGMTESRHADSPGESLCTPTRKYGASRGGQSVHNYSTIVVVDWLIFISFALLDVP